MEPEKRDTSGDIVWMSEREEVFDASGKRRFMLLDGEMVWGCK